LYFIYLPETIKIAQTIIAFANHQGGTITSFIFTLYSRHITRTNKRIADLNKRQKKAIEYLKQKGEITNREYRSINNVSNVIAAFELQALIKKGILRSEGKGRATHYLMEFVN